jgi:hypothetical protein
MMARNRKMIASRIFIFGKKPFQHRAMPILKAA